MKTLFRKTSSHARGSIAVECAIILPIFVLLMATMLLLGRIFWSYTVAEKAAHDAARFLATASIREMRTSGGGSEVPIVAAAKNLVRQEIQEISSGSEVATSVFCYIGETDPYWEECFGFETPRKIRVRVTVSINDPFFFKLTTWLNGGNPVLLKGLMSTDYVGN